MIDGKQIKGASVGVSQVAFRGAAMASISGAINTTETVLKTLAVPASYLAIGSTYRITLIGTCTSTVANLSTFTVRYGAAGSTSDLTIGTITCTAAASGTSVVFTVTLIVTVRAIGASGSLAAGGMIVNTGVTGISSVATSGASGAAVAADTTSAKILSIAYKSAAATTTCTFQHALLEQVAA